MLPVTVAKNCRVLSVPVERARNAYGGAIATFTGPVITLIKIAAAPLREGSAWLVAVSVTGFVGGADSGARYSTLPEPGPVGATHGFELSWHTWPTVALPFAIPLTDHATLMSLEFETAGVNAARWPGESVAALGETLTLTLLVIVTVADAVTVPLDGGVAVA